MIKGKFTTVAVVAVVLTALLAGSAGLAIEGEAEVCLTQGDYVFLPAHRRHRINWTDTAEPTVWLAVHIGEAEATGPAPR